MLNDSSTKSRWFELFVQVLVVYSIGAYYLESELTEAGYLSVGNAFFLWSERALAAFFAIEYLFRWFHAKNWLRYPFTLLAMIDLVAIVPFFVVFAVDLRSLKLFRTLRILRMFKLYRYNRALQNVMHGFRQVKDELAVVGFVVIVVVMFSSAAMHEFEHDAQPDKFSRLSDSVWWSLITLTTVGYGDLCPITAGGRVIAIVTMVIGSGIFGTFISLVGSSFLSTMRDGPRQQQQPTADDDSAGQEADRDAIPWLPSDSGEIERAA
jgi:voltage-gated potassium channel